MGRRHYPKEFKEKLVELALAGRSCVALSEEFGPHETTISGWAKQAERDRGIRKDGLTTEEQDELRRLRRENKQLKMEREILAKATAWFARETDKTPTGRSK